MSSPVTRQLQASNPLLIGRAAAAYSAPRIRSFPSRLSPRAPTVAVQVVARPASSTTLNRNCRTNRPFSSSARNTSAALASSEPSAADRKPLFTKILIANRGEIACRVIRTCRKLGIRTVAVYSEADKDAMHVKQADEAFCIGPAPSSESYLRADKIIGVCKKSGAQAIHPGYGFLSENADFADAIAKAGLVFIGPPSSSIVSMGSKSASKHLMQSAGVPVVPGYHEEDQAVATLLNAAREIGFPVLIKAVKGGGGKGMRIVEREEDFQGSMESARREAERSFGDGRVLVEKYLTKPRHVELQVFGDSHGNVVHLFERDCSVQRRHQKIIEEAPAPNLPPRLRRRMGESAVAAARAVGYRGAGTVEFILDADSLKSPNETDWRYYFMEMNTRLQVEHPVTEMVTGTDLVEWQLEVASGNPLPLLQDQIEANGHAFETRIYAEDPENNFFPAPGPLYHLQFPHPTQYLRVETGVQQGDSVGVFYDPMIAKLVTWGRDRTEALRRMEEGLRNTRVVGPGTNIEFLRRLCRDERFIAVDLDTGFIGDRKAHLLPPVPEIPNAEYVAAAVVGRMAAEGALPEKGNQDPWKAYAGFSVNSSGYRKVEFGWGPEIEKVGRRKGIVEVFFKEGGKEEFSMKIYDPSSKSPVAEFPRVAVVSRSSHSSAISSTTAATTTAFTLDVQPLDASQEPRILSCHTVIIPEGETDGSATVFVQGDSYQFSLPVPEHVRDMHKMEAVGSVKAPMPCRIISIAVQEGQCVEKGFPLVVLEAMKMEHVIKAPYSGVVKTINYKVGEQVPEGKLLLVVDEKTT